MTDFDAVKALKEEIMGVSEILGAITKRCNALSIKQGELEVELDLVTKLRGFASAELDRKRKVLYQLENNGGKGGQN